MFNYKLPSKTENTTLVFKDPETESERGHIPEARSPYPSTFHNKAILAANVEMHPIGYVIRVWAARNAAPPRRESGEKTHAAAPSCKLFCT